MDKDRITKEELDNLKIQLSQLNNFDAVGLRVGISRGEAPHTFDRVVTFVGPSDIDGFGWWVWTVKIAPDSNPSEWEPKNVWLNAADPRTFTRLKEWVKKVVGLPGSEITRWYQRERGQPCWTIDGGAGSEGITFWAEPSVVGEFRGDFKVPELGSILQTDERVLVNGISLLSVVTLLSVIKHLGENWEDFKDEEPGFD